jgi:hypothetical protein
MKSSINPTTIERLASMPLGSLDMGNPDKNLEFYPAQSERSRLNGN